MDRYWERDGELTPTAAALIITVLSVGALCVSLLAGWVYGCDCCGWGGVWAEQHARCLVDAETARLRRLAAQKRFENAYDPS